MSQRQAKRLRRALKPLVRESWGQIVKPRPWWLPSPLWWALIRLLLHVSKPRT